MVDIPDETAALLGLTAETAARKLLEDAVAQAYREEKIGSRGVREALGLASRFEVDPFLLRYEIYDLTPEMILQDIQTLKELHEKHGIETVAR